MRILILLGRAAKAFVLAFYYLFRYDLLRWWKGKGPSR